MKNFLDLVKGEKPVLLIVLLSILLRLAFGQIYAPLTNKDQYWEYGILAQNLKAGKGYSFLYFDNGKASYAFKSNAKPLPSAYMPPAYVAFLYPFLYIENITLRNLAIGTVQSILYGLVVFLAYLYTLKLFDKKTALCAAIIAAVLPEFIYLPFTIGPSVHYHFLVLLFFYLVQIIPGRYTLIYLGLTGASLIYFRAEFLLCIFMIGATLLWNKKWRIAFHLVLIPLFLLLPWSIRNFIVLNRFVPLTTSGGLNFYRGHNPQPGSWSGAMEDSFPELPHSSAYEVELNDIFLSKGIDFIIKNPGMEIVNEMKKLGSFWTIDLSDERSGKIAYWLPWLVLLVAAVLGIYQSFDIRKHQYAYLFFCYSSIVVVLFFSQVRYQSLMKIMLVPFAAHSVLWAAQRLKSKMKSHFIARN